MDILDSLDRRRLGADTCIPLLARNISTHDPQEESQEAPKGDREQGPTHCGRIIRSDLGPAHEQGTRATNDHAGDPADSTNHWSLPCLPLWVDVFSVSYVQLLSLCLWLTSTVLRPFQWSGRSSTTKSPGGLP